MSEAKRSQSNVVVPSPSAMVGFMRGFLTDRNRIDKGVSGKPVVHKTLIDKDGRIIKGDTSGDFGKRQTPLLADFLGTPFERDHYSGLFVLGSLLVAKSIRDGSPPDHIKRISDPETVARLEHLSAGIIDAFKSETVLAQADGQTITPLDVAVGEAAALGLADMDAGITAAAAARAISYCFDAQT